MPFNLYLKKQMRLPGVRMYSACQAADVARQARSNKSDFNTGLSLRGCWQTDCFMVIGAQIRTGNPYSLRCARRCLVTLLTQSLVLLLVVSLLVATAPAGLALLSDQPATTAPVQAAQQTPEQLQQLVALIALYPDALVAQILAASTYPDQVVEAERWMQQHSNLERDALWTQVDQQQWDPSVKALTQFPTVLANLDKNITWTSGLGDAYTNQQQEVMNAVQVMRQRAQKAGNLNTTPEQNVVSQGSTIIIQPVNPEVVYVPEFDPWLAYGPAVVAYPGWYPYTGLYIGGPGIFFGEGFGMGYVGAFGWGWPNWGFDWAGRRV